MFQYTWNYMGKTANEVKESVLGEVPITISELVSKVKDEAYNKTLQGLAEKSLEQGLTLNIKSVDVNGGYTTRIETVTVVRGETREIKYYKVWYTIHAVFETDQPLAGSPIAPALLVVLKWIIDAVVLAVIAYFAIQAIKSWLQSMSTETSTITTTTYDEEGNIIETVTEAITKPSPAGTTLMVIMIIAIAFLFLWGRR